MSRSSFRKQRSKGTAPRAKAQVGMKQRAFFGDDKNAAVAIGMGPVEAYWKRKRERRM